MPITRNRKLVSNESLQALFDIFESMSTVSEGGGLSFPSIRASADLEQILPDAFTVKPALRRSTAIQLFRKALYQSRRAGPLTAEAIIERAEQIYRKDRAVKLQKFTLWTKVRVRGMDNSLNLKFSWDDVSIRFVGQMPKWLQLAPINNSVLGYIDPSQPLDSGYIIVPRQHLWHKFDVVS